MANEKVLKFFDALKSNPELQGKLKTALSGLDKHQEDKGAFLTSVILPMAKESGFDITLDDIKEYMAQGHELDDEQMESVAGGYIDVIANAVMPLF